jgi:hypothetical protein
MTQSRALSGDDGGRSKSTPHPPSAHTRGRLVSVEELRQERTELFHSQRTAGVKLQQRASYVAMVAGLVLCFFGLACDAVATLEMTDLPMDSANFFQPVWFCGFYTALLSLLPSYRRAQLVLVWLYVVINPTM